MSQYFLTSQKRVKNYCILISRCIFILPEDLHTINTTTVPYELDVDIIKDCSNFKNEIREVLDVIDRDSDQYPVMMEKVSPHGSSIKISVWLLC